MRLTLVRHAIAAEGDDDFQRPLTTRGRARFEKSVQRLKRMKVRFEGVLHSPKVRALETAELLAPLVEGPYVSTEGLMKPPGKPLLQALQRENFAAVGHEPYLTQLLAWLVLGDADQADRFELKKGALARLEGQVQPGGMRLVALWTPKLLRGG